MRLTITQPSLAKYRVPVYRELEGRSDIELTLVYAQGHGITNVDPEGIHAIFCPMRRIPTPAGILLWHSAQIHYASKRYSDVLILSWDTHYLSLIPALLKARSRCIRTILWGHGYSKHESPLRQRLRDWIGKLASAVLLYDQSTANRLIERGFQSDKVFVAPNAIDQEPIQATRQHWLDRPHELASFQKERQLDHGPVILFVSRLDPQNRLDLLLKAVPQLENSFPGIQVVIIGKGDDERQRLSALAEDLDISRRVRFLGPIYDELELAPWFLSANVFCYPANIGLSLLHAFGYGLPVITSDKTEAQNPEIVALRQEENGLTYTDGDAEALAAALNRILADPALRDRLSREAHQTALRRYTLNKMVDGMEAAIRGGD